ncbi:MAG TPA: hypothetical protein VFA66_05210 [Gaiellaceae bacterium]|nr:hypothetical protein [Gaiellaceae bacterium]
MRALVSGGSRSTGVAVVGELLGRGHALLRPVDAIAAAAVGLLGR